MALRGWRDGTWFLKTTIACFLLRRHCSAVNGVWPSTDRKQARARVAGQDFYRQASPVARRGGPSPHAISFSIGTKTWHKWRTVCAIFRLWASFRNNSSLRIKKITPWLQSASELYRPSDSRLAAKLVPTFSDRRCHLDSVRYPYGRIIDFLDRSRYFSFK
jgi:hypothetical protein